MTVKLLDIIDRLETLEISVSALYRESAKCFVDTDPAFSTFLDSLADDEENHYEFLRKAGRRAMLAGSRIPSELILDDDFETTMKERIDSYMKRLDSGQPLDAGQVLNWVVTLESSEMNAPARYIFRLFSMFDREFQSAVAQIQEHLDEITDFLDETGASSELLERMRTVPAVWKGKALVVDDLKPIALLIAEILRTDGIEVEIASTGREGLDKFLDGYYDVVISDIEMPEMTGVDFFKMAREKDPGLDTRFIFVTGSHRHIPWLKEHDLKYFVKPFNIAHLQDAVAEMRKRTKRPASLE